MKTAAIASMLWLFACAKPAGGPLKYTFDNTRLAQVALDAKQPVTQAQQQHDLAQLQHTRADEEYRDSEVEQELAEYQAERSVLVSQLVGAKVEKPAPPTSETAALARRSADAKVAFMRGRRSWLEKLSRSSFYVVYAAQAKLELERAKVAQANNLAPAGFDVVAFEHQLEDRDRGAKDATAATEEERKGAETKLAAWTEAEHAFMQASGLKGPAESDRANQDWKAAQAAAAAMPEPTKPEPAVPNPATPDGAKPDATNVTPSPDGPKPETPKP